MYHPDRTSCRQRGRRQSCGSVPSATVSNLTDRMGFAAVWCPPDHMNDGRVVSASGTRQPVVLLIMDDQDSLAMYALGLLAMGIHPLAAGDADAGCSYARHCHPDVVVADVAGTSVAGLEL